MSESAPKNILFVCIENSNRSQMAEAFAKIHGRGVKAHSSGSRPSGIVNPKAIASMRELDYDLTRHASKSLEQIPQIEYDAVVTMGCGDACPFVQAKFREDWAIPDPKHLPPDEFRKIRDLIETKVKVLLEQLATDSAL
jgi:protein-tyrosine-phosphatase